MRSRVRSGPAFAGGGALLVLLALAVGACGGDGDAAGGASSGGGSSKAGGDYVLGGMTDQSGAFAANGVPQLKGFMGAIEVLNADGGIDGHKVKVIARDDGSDPSKGLTNLREYATRLKASAIVGLNSSVVAAAIAPAAAQYKIPLIGSGVPTNLIKPVQPYVYISQPDFNSQGQAQVDILDQMRTAGKLPAKPKIAVLFYTTPAGTQWKDTVVAYAKEKGIDVVETQSAQIGAADFGAQVAKIHAAKPDAILTFMNSAGLAPVINAFKKVGTPTDTPIVGYNSTTTATFMGQNGWPGFISLGMVKDPNTSTTGEFAKLDQAAATQKLSPDTPSFMDGYVQGLIVIQALKTCGYPCSGQQLQAALDKLSFDGAGLTFGPYQYTPDSHAVATVGQFERWDEASKKLVPEGDAIQLNK